MSYFFLHALLPFSICSLHFTVLWGFSAPWCGRSGLFILFQLVLGFFSRLSADDISYGGSWLFIWYFLGFTFLQCLLITSDDIFSERFMFKIMALTIRKAAVAFFSGWCVNHSCVTLSVEIYVHRFKELRPSHQ